MFLVLGSRPPFLPAGVVLVMSNWKHPVSRSRRQVLDVLDGLQDLSRSLITDPLAPLWGLPVNIKLISVRSDSSRIDIQLNIPGVAIPAGSVKGKIIPFSCK